VTALRESPSEVIYVQGIRNASAVLPNLTISDSGEGVSVIQDPYPNQGIGVP